MTVGDDTTVLIYDDFSRLLFFDTHREGCVLVNELSETSDPFRFLRAASLSNLKSGVSRVDFGENIGHEDLIPLDLRSCPIPLFFFL